MTAVDDAPHALRERRGHVLVVTMNRPRARNALSSEMLVRMEQAWVEIDEDPEIRVAIVTGAGGHFCAGADLKAMAAGHPDDEWTPRFAADPAKGIVDAELGHDCLAAASRRRDHDGITRQKRADGVFLKKIQRERQRDRELGQRLFDAPLISRVASCGTERRSGLDDFGGVVGRQGVVDVHISTNAEVVRDGESAAFAIRPI